MIPWYMSKTIWLNVILSLIGILTLISDALSHAPILTASGIIMVAVGALGVILRIWFTYLPVDTPSAPARLEQAQANAPMTLPEVASPSGESPSAIQ